MTKTKNIIIFVVIGVVLVLIYIFVTKQPAPSSSLLISSPLSQNTTTPDNNGGVEKDFLNLLLSVNSINLDDSIFSDNAFQPPNLVDSPIDLTPDGSEGRANPFAPLGTDVVSTPTITASTSATTTTTPTIPLTH